jgi:hypothetical protein
MSDSNKRIEFTLSEDEESKLDTMCRHYGLNRSDLLRTLIRGELAPLSRTGVSVQLEKEEILFIIKALVVYQAYGSACLSFSSAFFPTYIAKRTTYPTRELELKFRALEEQIRLSYGTDPAKLHPCHETTLIDGKSVPCTLQEYHAGQHKSEGGKKAVKWSSPKPEEL